MGRFPFICWSDKGTGVLDKEQNTNAGAFEVFSGLMFKTLLPQDEGSSTI